MTDELAELLLGLRNIVADLSDYVAGNAISGDDIEEIEEQRDRLSDIIRKEPQ